MTTQLEYFCVNAAGDKFIVVTGSGGPSYQMFVGPSSTEMREVAVFDLQRLRDGGTTYIFTAEGTFFAPSPLRPPMWGPGSDGSCRWPTAVSMEDACGWPTPDVFRVTAPLAEEEAFTRVDPANYVAQLSVADGIAGANQLVAALENTIRAPGDTSGSTLKAER